MYNLGIFMCMGLRIDILLFESQINEIVQQDFNEINVEKKDELGSGAFHKVYPSKINPNIVYKISQDRVVDRWYEVFKEFPELFPKVYKRGKTRVNVPANKSLVVSYVMVERLDTVRAKIEWGEIDDFIKSNGLGSSFESFIVDFENSRDDIELIYVMMRDQGLRDLAETYERYITLIDQIYEVFPSADLHGQQFGYDKNGELKCLDI